MTLLLFQFVTTAIFVMMGGRSSQIVDKVMYTQWVFFTLVFVGILVLRVKRPTMIRPFRVGAPSLLPLGLKHPFPNPTGTVFALQNIGLGASQNIGLA